MPSSATGESLVPQIWLHRFALGTALLTLPLVIVGGGVTSKDAGMVYQTAPLSDGALVNPAGWTQEVETLLEHGHRLIGWCVGIFATATAVLACFLEPRRWVRWLAVAALGAICLQGSMGIWRVNHDSMLWAMIHGVWGQSTFGVVACLALVTSALWHKRLPPVETEIGRPLRVTCVVMLAAVVGQLTLGVLTRQAAWSVGWHVMGATAVTFLIARVAFWILADVPPLVPLRRAALFLAVLVGVQLVLGMTSLVVTGGSSARVLNPAWIEWVVPTAHVAVGAIILATAACTTAMCFRAVRPAVGELRRGGAGPELTAA